MRNLWLVARAEYRRMVMRRSFLLATLGLPVFIGIVMAISIIAGEGGADERPFGYVDEAGIFRGLQPAQFGPLPAIPYPDQASAQAALADGRIQAFYVVPADYRRTGEVRQYYWNRAPQGQVNSQFKSMLRAALVADQPPERREPLLRGVNIVMQTASTGQAVGAAEVLRIVLPFLAGMFFVFVVMGSSGYMLQAVTTEKENRMVEVMFTSLSPVQLIGGKAVGLMGVALTQVGIWVAALAVGLFFLGRQFGFLSEIAIDGRFLGMVALYFLPTYALVAGMMITVGSMVTELQHGQQVAGVLNLLFIVPFFFFVFVFTNPDHPLLVALTLFPTTAFMAVAMRWGVTTIPAWQIALGWGLLVVAAVAMVWLASKVFRAGMLRYGQPLSLRSLGAVLRTS